MKPIIIFDLDGTLALVDHRRHHVTGRKPNFQAFDRACVNDTPNVPVVEIFKLLRSTNKYELVIFSGRGDAVRPETERWLKTNGIVYDRLMMRPGGHSIPDNDLKRTWLNTIVDKNNVFCVFDDRQKVVDMWREEGLTCFQVAEGNF